MDWGDVDGLQLQSHVLFHFSVSPSNRCRGYQSKTVGVSWWMGLYADFLKPALVFKYWWSWSIFKINTQSSPMAADSTDSQTDVNFFTCFLSLSKCLNTFSYVLLSNFISLLSFRLAYTLPTASLKNQRSKQSTVALCAVLLLFLRTQNPLNPSCSRLHTSVPQRYIMSRLSSSIVTMTKVTPTILQDHVNLWLVQWKSDVQAVQGYEQELSELFIGSYGFFLHPEQKMPISGDILAWWVTRGMACSWVNEIYPERPICWSKWHFIPPFLDWSFSGQKGRLSPHRLNKRTPTSHH